MKCKVLHANNPLLLEQMYNDWVSNGLVIEETVPGNWRGGVYWAIFYEGEVMVEPEPEPEPMAENVEAPPPQVLCPHCQCLTNPTTVERGPWTGRLKCTECNKTFVTEEAESDA